MRIKQLNLNLYKNQQKRLSPSLKILILNPQSHNKHQRSRNITQQMYSYQPSPSASNKRLKYYSTHRNKKQNQFALDDQNIQLLQEQFKKFQDHSLNKRIYNHNRNNIKNDVFNCIVKSAHRKVSNFTRTSNSQIREKPINKQIINKQIINQQAIDKPTINKNNQQLEDNYFIINLQNQQQIDFQNNFIVNKAQIKQDNTNQQQKQQKIQTIQLQSKPSIWGRKSTTQQIRRKDKHQNELKRSMRQKQRILLIKDERLKRHIFNKSSMSKFYIGPHGPHGPHGAYQQKFQEGCNRILVQNLTQRKGYQKPQQSEISRRYLSIKPPSPQLSINPYTNRQYLHIQNKASTQLKNSLQKMIKSSLSQNMMKSLNVKPIQQKAKQDNVERNSYSKLVRHYNQAHKDRKKLKDNSNLQAFDIEGWSQINFTDQQLQCGF